METGTSIHRGEVERITGQLYLGTSERKVGAMSIGLEGGYCSKKKGGGNMHTDFGNNEA